MIKVLKPGFYSSIQDLGRRGYQQFGVPVSGVMDVYSAKMVNAILGNDKNTAVIEMTMTGVTLQFNCDINICISGAEMNPMLNGIKIDLNKSVSVVKSDILSFGKLNNGFRCYLAVSGGFQSEVRMNSRSMFKGITNQNKLKKDDELKVVNSSETLVKHASIRVNNTRLFSETIDVYRGPEFDKLSASQIETLLNSKFTISKANNRMGYQLVEPLENDLKSIITSSVMPGTVQLTPSGKLIILMRDCQTTGGYPRVLQLKETSIDVLAQKFTNQTLSFKLIDY